MTFTGYLLLPFTLVYSLAVRLRNHLYNIQYSRSLEFEIPIILVGNISVGGTGKTPAIEYLVNLLSKKYKLATLSRGYKRRTQGFRIADETDNADSLGDEMAQLYQKFGSDITIAVGADRALAIPEILFAKPETQVILMDDGYQHRSVNPGFKILLTDYTKPFYRDYLLPSGRLREPRKEARRADVIIVTKCPEDIPDQEQSAIKDDLSMYCAGMTPIFFSTLKYGNVEPLFDWTRKAELNKVIVISGIANPIPFDKYASSKWKVLNVQHFSDHQNYTSQLAVRIRNIWKEYNDESLAIIVTEKDAVKLTDSSLRPHLEGIPFYKLPVRMELLEDGAKFESMIEQAIITRTGF